jgi:hypothetical protein
LEGDGSGVGVAEGAGVGVGPGFPVGGPGRVGEPSLQDQARAASAAAASARVVRRIMDLLPRPGPHGAARRHAACCNGNTTGPVHE